MTLTDKLDVQTIKPSRGIVESVIMPVAKKTWDLGMILLGAYIGATQHKNPAIGAVIGTAIGYVVGPLSRYVFFQNLDENSINPHYSKCFSGTFTWLRTAPYQFIC